MVRAPRGPVRSGQGSASGLLLHGRNPSLSLGHRQREPQGSFKLRASGPVTLRHHQPACLPHARAAAAALGLICQVPRLRSAGVRTPRQLEGATAAGSDSDSERGCRGGSVGREKEKKSAVRVTAARRHHDAARQPRAVAGRHGAAALEVARAADSPEPRWHASAPLLPVPGPPVAAAPWPPLAVTGRGMLVPWPRHRRWRRRPRAAGTLPTWLARPRPHRAQGNPTAPSDSWPGLPVSPARTGTVCTTQAGSRRATVSHGT
jgi:hypothetical protein